MEKMQLLVKRGDIVEVEVWTRFGCATLTGRVMSHYQSVEDAQYLPLVVASGALREIAFIDIGHVDVLAGYE